MTVALHDTAMSEGRGMRRGALEPVASPCLSHQEGRKGDCGGRVQFFMADRTPHVTREAFSADGLLLSTGPPARLPLKFVGSVWMVVVL
ncbi:hypothetical protein E2562_002282 [Oryza meyeriana var. granulata]|uniref:Uncharacterized protein n=1 Tax=Oryza meyeriana var. granulata TaxID=110450 RepID=A0A6G1BI11_9ORYZ|nr:hypothetical protein E2562_002282 [Oryza meyeriana var. granulata]